MQDVLLYMIDSLHKAVDGHMFVVAGFLDLAKAFDCVNHDILLDNWFIMVLWIMLIHSMVASKQSSLMVAPLLSILLMSVSYRANTEAFYCSLFL